VAGKRLFIAVILLGLASVGAIAKSNHHAFEHGITGYTPAQFALECIKCQREAFGAGRSVRGDCPGDCGDVYGKEICDSGDMEAHCRPGPASQLKAPAPLAQSAASAGTEWRVGSSDGVVSAMRFVHGLETSLTCNAQMRATFLTVTFDKYKGGLLKTVQDAESPFILDVHDASGKDLKFPVIAYYTVGDGGDNWVFEKGLTPAFLDAFGQDGGRLSWRTTSGVEITSWPLQGTAKARSMMRQICNF
jgi:hypothetical protein